MKSYFHRVRVFIGSKVLSVGLWLMGYQIETVSEPLTEPEEDPSPEETNPMGNATLSDKAREMVNAAQPSSGLQWHDEESNEEKELLPGSLAHRMREAQRTR